MADISVTYTGNVEQAGPVSFATGSRLFELAHSIPTDSAWVPGAALFLTQNYSKEQSRKSAMLEELKSIYNSTAANKDADKPLSEWLLALRSWIQTQPITGRQLTTTLDPYQLEIEKTANLKIGSDARLNYPNRPDYISVIGLNGTTDSAAPFRKLPYLPGKDIQSYLNEDDIAPWANKNEVYVIAPSGRIEKVGIAAWNFQKVRLIPGSWVYIPIEDDALAAAPHFNEGFVQWLTTRTLP
ncbi:capsule biosynthesis GfcC family protein [Pokkaliibacter sp. MBI-7]|uniref:capsule biosynthesis GfcC family protein n=1 Tax=Pokkaliibacter sp. MBI-7 TaxID=3040600 RepID=UPI0024477536|nr:capsule biosynthesis GfcC family protein [Pokkaliibacter sp. MBI-7]MDH2434209.1 capsule biosynthesis GfcC family protein [Pokkaliibacter sp. MBI-7]